MRSLIDVHQIVAQVSVDCYPVLTSDCTSLSEIFGGLPDFDKKLLFYVHYTFSKYHRLFAAVFFVLRNGKLVFKIEFEDEI